MDETNKVLLAAIVCILINLFLGLQETNVDLSLSFLVFFPLLKLHIEVTIK